MMQSLFGAGGTGDAIDAALAAADIAQVAGPWRQMSVIAIGGLTAVGFDRGRDEMLVASSNGQSIISGQTGQMLYRNRNDDGLDVAALKGTRLDSPADERLDMAGLFGGGLRRVTDDGWSVEIVRDRCVLHPKNASIHFMDPAWESYRKDTTFHLLDHGAEEIRAYGFSWTGRSLIIATPSTLSIWARPAPLTL